LIEILEEKKRVLFVKKTRDFGKEFRDRRHLHLCKFARRKSSIVVNEDAAVTHLSLVSMGGLRHVPCRGRLENDKGTIQPFLYQD
jgi:hypothetical protein